MKIDREYKKFRELSKDFENSFYNELGIDVKFSTNTPIVLKTKFGKIRVEYDGAGLLTTILANRNVGKIEKIVGKSLNKIIRIHFSLDKEVLDIKQKCKKDTRKELGYSYYFPISYIIRDILRKDY